MCPSTDGRGGRELTSCGEGITRNRSRVGTDGGEERTRWPRGVKCRTEPVVPETFGEEEGRDTRKVLLERKRRAPSGEQSYHFFWMSQKSRVESPHLVRSFLCLAIARVDVHTGGCGCFAKVQETARVDVPTASRQCCGSSLSGTLVFEPARCAHLSSWQ